MIRVEADRIEVSGPMLMADASRMLAEGEMAMASLSLACFDLTAVTEMDSSALAVIFGWMRAAQASAKSVRLVNPPQNLLNLAEVYGVADLLPQH